MSAAYMKLFKQRLKIKQPILEFSSLSRRVSIYKENRRGERMPPCLTPAETLTGTERE